MVLSPLMWEPVTASPLLAPVWVLWAGAAPPLPLFAPSFFPAKNSVPSLCMHYNVDTLKIFLPWFRIVNYITYYKYQLKMQGCPGCSLDNISWHIKILSWIKNIVQCIKKLIPGCFAALIVDKIPWQINLFSRELSALISKRSFNTTHK